MENNPAKRYRKGEVTRSLYQPRRISRRMVRWLVAGLFAMLVLGLAVLAMPNVTSLFINREAALQEAREKLMAGDVSAASKLVQKATRGKEDWAEAQPLIAEIALARLDADAAITAVQAARIGGIADNQLYGLEGHAYWLKGNAAKAQMLLTQDITPEQKGYTRRILGRVYVDMGRMDDARDALNQALEYGGDNAAVWNDIAYFRWQANDPLAAVEAADKAIALDGNYTRALQLRGELAQHIVGPAAALPYFEKAVKQAPEDRSVLRLYAAALGSAGRQKDMLVITRKILKIAPGDAQALFLMGALAARGGEPEIAKMLLSRAEPALKERPAFLLTLGAVEYNLKNYNAARDHFEELVQLQPSNLMARKLLAQSFYQSGEFKNALDQAKPLADRLDADDYGEMLTGRAWEGLDQRADAAWYLQRAAYIDNQGEQPLDGGASLPILAREAAAYPDNPRAVIPYLRALAGQGRSGEALPSAQRLLARNPNVADAHMLVGDLLAVAGRNLDAARAYEAAKRLRFNTALMLRLYDAYTKAGAHNEAGLMLGNFEAAHPFNLAAQRLRFERAIESGNWAEAIAYGHAIMARIGGHNPVMLAQMARAFAQLGDMDKAQAYAARAYDLQPSSPLATHVYGYVLLEKGELKITAMQLLEKAAKLSPQNRYLRYHLARAYVAANKLGKARAAIGFALGGERFLEYDKAMALAKKLGVNPATG